MSEASVGSQLVGNVMDLDLITISALVIIREGFQCASMQENIGFVVMTFGPSYSYSLIRMYDQRWIDGEVPEALQYYCLYVFLLAVNGTAEAFMHAVATEEQRQHSNVLSFIFSVIYLGQNALKRQSGGAVVLVVKRYDLEDYILDQLRQSLFPATTQGSPTFSFLSCLPSGWREFLDPENWPTFFILSIGLNCFCMFSFIRNNRRKR